MSIVPGYLTKEDVEELLKTHIHPGPMMPPLTHHTFPGVHTGPGSPMISPAIPPGHLGGLGRTLTSSESLSYLMREEVRAIAREEYARMYWIQRLMTVLEAAKLSAEARGAGLTFFDWLEVL